MKDKNEFYSILQEIDGRELPELTRLLGDYDFNRFIIKIAPMAPDEREAVLPIILRVTHAISAFPVRLLESPLRRTALEDFLTRKLLAAIGRIASYDATGTARRLILPPRIGQKILPRSTVQIADDYTDVRLRFLVPMQRNRIDATAFQSFFFEQMPELVQEALLYCNMDLREVESFVEAMENADEIRRSLSTKAWIGFIGDGSMPHRKSGADTPDYEYDKGLAIDASLSQTVETALAGEVKGAAIKPGVTLILGDIKEGRVELMRAIAAGIYNHVSGDGREYIVTMPDAVYISAEGERSVQRADIGCFTGSGDFTSFRADALHGQAASFVEALEAGARVIICDEADSAPGFLGGDNRLQSLIGDNASFIPLAARVRQLSEELGVSTIVGGQHAVGSFIPVADDILLIEGGTLRNITKEAKSKWAGGSDAAIQPYDFTHLVETARWVIPSSIDASVGRYDSVVDAPDENAIRFGRHTIQLSALHQVADAQQALTIGLIIEYARQRYLDQPRPVRELLDLVDRDLSTEGLDHVTRELRGDLARPRRYEIAAALNRLASLRVSRAAL